MGKRIKTLAAAASIAETDVLAIDNGTLTEAQKISITQLRTTLFANMMQSDSGVVIAAGANAIVFPGTLAAATFKITYTALNAAGDNIFGAISARAVDGFTFTCSEAGTLEYIAIL